MTTKDSQTILGTALDSVFASTARPVVLQIFMLDPLRAYYQRQLEAATGLPIRAVQREVERLRKAGLLYRRVEGNRTYYQVNTDFPLFPELRSMILKVADDVGALRGRLAMHAGVRLAFLSETKESALVVMQPGAETTLTVSGPIAVEVMSSADFTEALAEKRDPLDPYLLRGVDLLGRREEVIWRRIEAAGYDVQKGEGVP